MLYNSRQYKLEIERSNCLLLYVRLYDDSTETEQTGTVPQLQTDGQTRRRVTVQYTNVRMCVRVKKNFILLEAHNKIGFPSPLTVAWPLLDVPDPEQLEQWATVVTHLTVARSHHCSAARPALVFRFSPLCCSCIIVPTTLAAAARIFNIFSA